MRTFTEIAADVSFATSFDNLLDFRVPQSVRPFNGVLPLIS